MGLSTSKQFQEMFENPPPTPPTAKKVLTEEFDPRSPSCQITRTPIQVVKTPEHVSAVADPRSPTEGIDRTPIFGKYQTVTDDGASPVVCRGLLEDEKEASQESATTDTATPARYDSTEDLLPATRVQMAPDGSKVVVKKKKKPKTLFKIHSTPTPKDVSPFKVKNGEITAAKDGKSSPLGSRNVDYNSPRAIVQRKQTDKLAFMKASNIPKRCAAPKYQVMEDDKENIHY